MKDQRVTIKNPTEGPPAENENPGAVAAATGANSIGSNQTPHVVDPLGSVESLEEMRAWCAHFHERGRRLAERSFTEFPVVDLTAEMIVEATRETVTSTPIREVIRDMVGPQPLVDAILELTVMSVVAGYAERIIELRTSRCGTIVGHA